MNDSDFLLARFPRSPRLATVDGVELEFELLTFESLSLSSSSSFICFLPRGPTQRLEASPFSPTSGVEVADFCSSLNYIV